MAISPLILSVIAQGLSNYLGTNAANSHAKDSENLMKQNLALQKQRALAEPKSYLDTEEGRTLATRAGEDLKEATNIINNNAVKTGMTDQQRLAQQAAVNKAYGNTIQGLAAKSTQYRQANEDRLLNAQQGYNNAQIALNSQKANNAQTAGANIGNALGNGITAEVMMKSMDAAKPATEGSTAQQAMPSQKTTSAEKAFSDQNLTNQARLNGTNQGQAFTFGGDWLEDLRKQNNYGSF